VIGSAFITIISVEREGKPVQIAGARPSGRKEARGPTVLHMFSSLYVVSLFVDCTFHTKPESLCN
jgi:hypothetical protein